MYLHFTTGKKLALECLLGLQNILAYHLMTYEAIFEVVVIFKTQLDEAGNYVPNNFVVTGWAKYMVPKR